MAHLNIYQNYVIFLFISAFQSDDEIDEVLEEVDIEKHQRKQPPPRQIKRQTTDELPPTPVMIGESRI